MFWAPCGSRVATSRRVMDMAYARMLEAADTYAKVLEAASNMIGAELPVAIMFCTAFVAVLFTCACTGSIPRHARGCFGFIWFHALVALAAAIVAHPPAIPILKDGLNVTLVAAADYVPDSMAAAATPLRKIWADHNLTSLSALLVNASHLVGSNALLLLAHNGGPDLTLEAHDAYTEATARAEEATETTRSWVTARLTEARSSQAVHATLSHPHVKATMAHPHFEPFTHYLGVGLGVMVGLGMLRCCCCGCR